MSGPSIGHTGAPASGILERVEPDFEEVANRDVRIARQNIAELMVYVDDHAAHLANCASANDDSLTLMSAELIPRLEGGIRAVLDEAANL